VDLRCNRAAKEKRVREPGQGRPKKVSQDVTLPELGINRMQSHRWQIAKSRSAK